MFKNNIFLIKSNDSLLLSNQNNNSVDVNNFNNLETTLYPTKKSVTVLPTNEIEYKIYSIIDSEEKLLSTTSFNDYINSINNKKLQQNSQEVLATEKKKLTTSHKLDKILPTNFNDFYTFNKSIINPLTTIESKIVKTSKTINNIFKKKMFKQQNNFAYLNDNQMLKLKTTNSCFLNASVIDIIIAINNDLLEINKIDLFKKTIKTFVESLNLEPDQCRLCLLHYGFSIRIPINLGGYHEKDEIINQINSLTYNEMLGLPSIKNIYSAAYQQFESFGRKNVKRLMIVFSSGKDL